MNFPLNNVIRKKPYSKSYSYKTTIQYGDDKQLKNALQRNTDVIISKNTTTIRVDGHSLKISTPLLIEMFKKYEQTNNMITAKTKLAIKRRIPGHNPLGFPDIQKIKEENSASLFLYQQNLNIVSFNNKSKMDVDSVWIEYAPLAKAIEYYMQQFKTATK